MRLWVVDRSALREPKSAWPILTLAEPMSALAHFEIRGADERLAYFGAGSSGWPVSALACFSRPAMPRAAWPSR
jgi:hypothetical protein